MLSYRIQDRGYNGKKYHTGFARIGTWPVNRVIFGEDDFLASQLTDRVLHLISSPSILTNIAMRAQLVKYSMEPVVSMTKVRSPQPITAVVFSLKAFSLPQKGSKTIGII